MLTFAKIRVLGHAGKDAKLFTSTSGVQGANISLAVSTGKDKDPLWIKATIFKNESRFSQVQYDIATQIKKGDLCQVEGRAGIDKWKDEKTGETICHLSVVVSELQHFGRRSEGAQEPIPRPEDYSQADTGEIPF